MDRDLTFEEYKQFLTNMKPDGDFSFGFNWLDYVKTRLNEDIINVHQQNLKSVYNKAGISLEGKSVLDIGCGSGLSSLSFSRLGSSNITSLDVDPYSVQATTLTRQRFDNNNPNWSVREGSILNEESINDLEVDIVYTWGVLHHTGDMWNAIRNSIKPVKNGGYYHIALYRSGNKYTEHLEDKFKYRFASKEEKMYMLYRRKKGGKGVNIINARGMNKFHDSIDWLGGVPYEVCDPEVLFAFLSKYGFEPVYFTDGPQGGNFVAVLKKD